MTMTSQHGEAQVFAHVARELAGQDGLKATLQRIPGMARAITGCDTAILWTVSPRSKPKVSAADPVLAAAHAKAVLTMAEGVDWQCLQDGSVVIVDDMRAERRWPIYCQLTMLAPKPLLSFVALPLRRQAGAGGALVMASHQPSYFSDDLVEVATIFADHAAIAMVSAAAEDRAENLQQALASSRRIGIAVGIIMARSQCTAEQAFDLLRVASQTSKTFRLKLREVAEEVILTGSMPAAAAVSDGQRGRPRTPGAGAGESLGRRFTGCVAT